MPIYEYSCAKCGRKIEVIQKFSDKPLTKHEKCGGVLTKLISASSFQLKGTGWYKTDYAAKADKPEAKEGSQNGKKEAAGGGDAKPETAAGTSGESAPSSSTKAKPSEKPGPRPKSRGSKD
jgi:putative FmdB family regulatory protein